MVSMAVRDIEAAWCGVPWWRVLPQSPIVSDAISNHTAKQLLSCIIPSVDPRGAFFSWFSHKEIIGAVWGERERGQSNESDVAGESRQEGRDGDG